LCKYFLLEMNSSNDMRKMQLLRKKIKKIM
jgi:hypothetical protein